MSTCVLVAGGAGYIGSHVCKALAAAGFRPVALDTLEKGHDWAVRWGPLVRADIGDRAALEAAFAEHRPTAIVNLAGYIEVGESVRQPQRFWQNNVAHTATLIELAIQRGIAAFLFSSTCAVYGTPRAALDERHVFNPESPYGETKLAVERLLERAAGRGLRSLSLRYFNAAGADADGEIGEAHAPETHLIPLAIAAALQTGKPLTVFGTDYDTPDGTCLRDYVHVGDVAQAHVLGLQRLLAGSLDLAGLSAPAVADEARSSLLAPSNRGDVAHESGGCHVAMNLGSGAGSSVREVIDTVSQVCGKAVPHSLGARRNGDPPRLVGSIAKARTMLGWQPQHGLVRQVEDALRWQRRWQAMTSAAAI